MTTALLKNARAVRKQLLASALYSAASIRDAVELAADNLRQLADEDEADRRATAWVSRHFPA
ncbi:hypothetical protein EN858_14840 [Mesorhizobium sp. M4B.F.Ca.ET.215.01.1.1]|uniref:hypothetical protein n=1 Tax=unclassified Mesorhizobium TaxID=325217 RepID=UPI001093D2A7|nr:MULTISPECIES: hypothetical protein [unclassified Mesorhizobium]TGQ11197.1 hypothetical protein EN858_14840 [Mesorhizobium sp. M4B.F.Ca.ET.215.01.1.1]TGR04750.1 hypothetical protein EN846_13240 [Mesorhizobium sp. M4B.F.Ca.ET.203.01.1.1]